jgi:hypothetical protein
MRLSGAVANAIKSEGAPDPAKAHKSVYASAPGVIFDHSRIACRRKIAGWHDSLSLMAQ